MTLPDKAECVFYKIMIGVAAISAAIFRPMKFADVCPCAQICYGVLDFRHTLAAHREAASDHVFLVAATRVAMKNYGRRKRFGDNYGHI